MDYSFDSTDFTQPDDLSNVTLVVEDQKLFANKTILATASPVWKRMFLSDFKEKHQTEINLPGKKFEDVLELLRCIYPSVRKPVYDKNVLQILPLADEYQMMKLKGECEELLISKLQHDAPAKQFMQYIVEAQTFRLEKLLEKGIRLAASLTLIELENRPEYPELQQDSYIKILRSRVRFLEKRMSEHVHTSESWMSKAEELEKQVMLCEREKQRQCEVNGKEMSAIVRDVELMKNSWDLKGAEARCDDQVHMYGDRNLECSKCNEELQRYINRVYEKIVQDIQKLAMQRQFSNTSITSGSYNST